MEPQSLHEASPEPIRRWEDPSAERLPCPESPCRGLGVTLSGPTSLHRHLIGVHPKLGLRERSEIVYASRMGRLDTLTVTRRPEERSPVPAV